jgi:hypothetical protein
MKKVSQLKDSHPLPVSHNNIIYPLDFTESLTEATCVPVCYKQVTSGKQEKR